MVVGVIALVIVFGRGMAPSPGPNFVENFLPEREGHRRPKSEAVDDI
jgi:hypothetical protein